MPGGLLGSWLIAEPICGPVFAIVGTLKLDLVSAAGHDAEKAISIGNPKRLERHDRRGG
jgi:hypothetical protein